MDELRSLTTLFGAEAPPPDDKSEPQYPPPTDNLRRSEPYVPTDNLRRSEPEPESTPLLSLGSVFKPVDQVAEQSRRLEGARKEAEKGGEDTFHRIITRSLPYASEIVKFAEAKGYDAARRRFEAGEASNTDLAKIAGYERYQKQTADRDLGGMLGDAALSAPALIGEFGVGGKAVGLGAKALGIAPAVSRVGKIGQFVGGMAATTPLVPTQYADLAIQKNLAEGRRPEDPRGLPPALGLAFASNLVLGRLQGHAARILGGFVPRVAGSGAVGVVEQGGVDAAAGVLDEFLPKEWQTGTRGGVPGSLLRGEAGEAGKHAAVQFLTFSAFAAMHQHKGQDQLRKDFERATESAKPDQVAEVGTKVQQAVQSGADPAKLFEGQDGPLADLGRGYADVVQAGMTRTRRQTAPVLQEATGKSPEVVTPQGATVEIPPKGASLAHPLANLDGPTVKKIAGELGTTVGKLRKSQSDEGMPERIESAKTKLGLKPAAPPVAPPEAVPEPPVQTPAKPEIVAPEASGAVKPAEFPDTVKLIPRDLEAVMKRAGLSPTEIAVIQTRLQPGDMPSFENIVVRRPKGRKGGGKPYTRQRLEQLEASGLEKLKAFADAEGGQFEGSIASMRAQLGLEVAAAKPERQEHRSVEGTKTKRNVIADVADGFRMPAPKDRAEAESGLAAEKEERASAAEHKAYEEALRKIELKVRKEIKNARRELRPPDLGLIERYRDEAAKIPRPRDRRSVAPDQAPPVQGEAAAKVGREAEQTPQPEATDAVSRFLADEGGFVDPKVVGAAMFSAVRRIRDAVFGKKIGKDASYTDPDPNPDNQRSLAPYPIRTRMAYNQVGAKNAKPHEIAMTTWAATKEMGKQYANDWLRTRPADPFEKVPLQYDVVEAEMKNPGSQNLTAEQRQAVKVLRDSRDKAIDDMQRAGVKEYWDDATDQRIPWDELKKTGYVHRAAVPDAPQFPGLGSRPGVKQSHQKSRRYDTQADGEANGVEYKPGVFEAHRDFLEQVYRRIADHQWTNDPKMRGRDLVPQKIREGMAKNKSALDATAHYDAIHGTDTNAELKQQIIFDAHQMAKGNLEIIPGAHGKEYPPEVASAAMKQYTEGGDTWKAMNKVSQFLRGLVLSADMSYAGLQLQAMMFSNPARWAKAMAHGVRSGLWEGAFERYAARPENRAAITEMVQHGARFGMRDEAGSGHPIENVKIVGEPFKRANRAMTTALDVAKVELFKANRGKASAAELPRLVEGIELSLGQGRMEQLGMRPERALIERVALLAPAFYRGWIGLWKQAFQTGAPARFARKQLGALASGVFLLSVGNLYRSYLMGDISWDELEERLNPARGKFLMTPLPIGDDKRVEVGFGGFYLNMVRTLAASKKYAEAEGRTENPLVKWYKGHAGILPRAALDTATGTDYAGNPTTLPQTVARAIAPIAVQQSLMGDAPTTHQNVAQAIPGLAGLRSFPESEPGKRYDLLRKSAEAEGRKYGDLSILEQAALVKKLPGEKPPSTPGSKMRAIDAAEARRKSLAAAVSKDTRKALEEFGHPLPGYDAVLSFRGVPVPLTPKRQEEYEKLLAEEYDRTVKAWPRGKMQAATKEAREQFITSSLEQAKGRARARLVQSTVAR